MTRATEPKCTEVLVSSSVGGRVQIVKYEYSADFHYSQSRKYDIPPGWTEQDVDDFQKDKTIQLRSELEPHAQAEMDDLLKQREELNE